MPDPARRVALFRRMVRMREAERHAAAVRVAEAAGLYGKLLALHARSGEIAAAYANHNQAKDGHTLAHRLKFAAGLQSILRETEGDRRRAERSSEEAINGLRLAERRRDIAAERLMAERQAAEKILSLREGPVLARKLKGVGQT